MGSTGPDESKDGRPFWWTETVDQVVVLKFHGNIAIADMHIQDIWRLLEFLDELAKGPNRVLLVQFSTGQLDHRGFVQLWERFRSIADDAGRAQLELMREDCALRRWITCMRDHRLFTIGAFQGELDINFLGMFLACDYRIASEDSVVVNRGRPPGTGHGTAVPWLLAHILRPGDAMHILLGCERLPAYRARELGLIQHTTNPRSHVEDALRITQTLASEGTANLLTLKRAMATSSAPLDKYFQSEGAGFDRLPHLFTQPPTCVQCGYNLTGNVSGRCPECGWPTDMDTRRMT